MDLPAKAAAEPSPPLRKGFRRLLYFTASIAILLAAAALAAPWIFSNAALRGEIAAQIRHLTGLNAASQDRAVFVVLPRPHISVEDVRFASPNGALRIEARYLKGYLRLLPLFTGRIEIASATLGQPDMEIDLDARLLPPDSVIGRAAEAAPATPEAQSADEATLGVVVIADGRAKVRSKQLSQDLSIEEINLTLDWRKPGAAAVATGRANVRGVAAELTAWVASPAALLRGQQSLLSFNLAAPSLSFAAEGSVASTPKWQFNGHLRAAAPSLQAIFDQAGQSVPLPGPFAGFSASCDASIEPANAVFSGLRLRFDGNEVEGTLAVQAGGAAPVLSGTLAATQLSLLGFQSSLQAAAGRDGQWSREPLNLHGLGSIDMDLRISAARMLFSRFEFEDAAISLMRSGERMEVILAGAKIYQGTTKGRAAIELGDSGISVKATGVTSGADLAALSYDLFGWPEFYGSLTGTVNLESSGASMRDLMRNLKGLARIDVANGQIGRIDLNSALRGIDKSPLALLSGIRRGRTAFDHADLGLHFDKGVASIEDGKLESASLKVAFGGTVDFAERGLDLHAVARSSLPAAAPGKETPDFRFDVGGAWDDLAFAPDVRDLIRRSGAAAPLLPRPPDAAKAPANGAAEVR
ncbi:MAG: AsmA family protein [Beijerinckiaceae bacterium]|nr:AsmA family protein [Beijerinckiaceae bacterium]